MLQYKPNKLNICVILVWNILFSTFCHISKYFRYIFQIVDNIFALDHLWQHFWLAIDDYQFSNVRFDCSVITICHSQDYVGNFPIVQRFVELTETRLLCIHQFLAIEIHCVCVRELYTAYRTHTLPLFIEYIVFP